MMMVYQLFFGVGGGKGVIGVVGGWNVLQLSLLLAGMRVPSGNQYRPQSYLRNKDAVKLMSPSLYFSE